MPLERTTTYGEKPDKTPVLLVGSHDLVEVALVRGHAGRDLGIAVGDEVIIRVG
jgi:S-adenosylmethionine hydrolase